MLVFAYFVAVGRKLPISHKTFTRASAQKEDLMEDKPIRAVVQKVIAAGKHGPYAIALSSEVKGSITFSLNKSVWHETSLPKPGVEVVLSDLQRFKKVGWRALSGRFLRPADEQQADQK